MLNITKKPSDKGAVVLKLEGDATIEHAEQLHKALLEELQDGDHLMIDCEQVASCDFFTIQMFCSAHRTSIKWGKYLAFQGFLSPAVKEAIRSTGFLCNSGCSFCSDDDICMWINHASVPTNEGCCR